MQGKVHSIETFGTVDGPGIRYVVFMQGCPMRCLYCHNPDTWDTRAGTIMDVEEIVSQVEKYKNYYDGEGAITLSGGEPLLQIDFVTELFKRCKEKGINTCLDTSGITFNSKDTKKFDELIRYVDLVMLDIKQATNKKHKQLTGCSNEAVFEFLAYLDEKKIPVWIRHVLVPTLTTEEEDLKLLRSKLDQYSCIQKIEILPYHKMGMSKYEKLGLKYPLEGVEPPTKEMINEATDILKGGK